MGESYFLSYFLESLSNKGPNSLHVDAGMPNFLILSKAHVFFLLAQLPLTFSWG